jgi:hypothetical protein
LCDVPDEAVCLEGHVSHSPQVIGEKCDIRTRSTFHAQEAFYTSQRPAILYYRATCITQADQGLIAVAWRFEAGQFEIFDVIANERWP